jgi:molecular chaperone IbpA
MATLDFTPLFRSSIGFDQLPGLLAHALQREDTGFPPYDIEKLGEDQYRIVLAIAGFTKDDVEIVRDQNLVTVRGRVKDTGPKTYFYRGLAARNFERQFDLAEYIEVTGASLNNGLLEIALKRELPEALKPRRIPIGDGMSGRRVDGPAQAAALKAA